MQKSDLKTGMLIETVESKSVEEVTIKEDINSIINKLDTPEGLDQYSYDEGFKEGYKAASAKKWSDEDIEKAIQFGIDITCKHTTSTHGTNFDKVEDDKNNYIVSLQPKIKSIEIEMTQGAYDFLDCPVIGEERPMTYEKDGKTFLKVKSVTYE